MGDEGELAAVGPQILVVEILGRLAVEVQALQDEVAMGQRRGLAADGEAAEELVVLALVAQVVVADEGPEPERLGKRRGRRKTRMRPSISRSRMWAVRST